MKSFLFVLLIACAAALNAADGKPACADGSCAIGEISQSDLAKAIAAKQVAVIDVNGSESWSEGHIPGAIDFTKHEGDLASLLPADKSALIVAYCGGPQCNAYLAGAKAACELGYTNVKHFKGGISGWKDAKAPTEAGEAH